MREEELLLARQLGIPAGAAAAAAAAAAGTAVGSGGPPGEWSGPEDSDTQSAAAAAGPSWRGGSGPQVGAGACSGRG